MAHFVFFSNSIAATVPPPLLCSTCLTSLLNMFWAIQQELFFMPILRKFANLATQKRTMMEIFWVKPLAYSIKIYWSGTLLRSSFDGFSRIAIIWNSCKIIDKICSSPLVIFQKMAYIFLKVIRNGKTFECSVFN